MKTTCYLVLYGQPRGNWTDEVKAVHVRRVTQRKGRLEAGEARVKLALEVDPKVFDPQSVAVTVDTPHVELAIEPEDAEAVA